MTHCRLFPNTFALNHFLRIFAKPRVFAGGIFQSFWYDLFHEQDGGKDRKERLVMRKKLLAMLVGAALISFALILTGCTEDASGGGCTCQADDGGATGISMRHVAVTTLAG